MRKTLSFIVALVVFVSFASADERPNILIILADDLGFSDLGYLGGEIDTPNLDRLAANGLNFLNFYNCARCGPTRASIATGLYNHQVGVYENEAIELGNHVFISELLEQNGYGTYMSGKWHLGNTPEKLPPARGFMHSYAYQGCCGSFWEPDLYVLESPEVEGIPYGPGEFHATDATTDYAVKFLEHHERNEGEKPFFLYLAYQAPHFPIHARKELIDKYVETYRKGWDRIREERWERIQQKGLFPRYANLPARADSPPWHDEFSVPTRIRKWEELSQVETDDQVRRMATYAAMVDQMDRGIGKVLKQVEQSGSLENTIVFFLSDNGGNYEGGPLGGDGPYVGGDLAEMGQRGTLHRVGSSWAATSNTPFKLYKHFNHEGGIRTPFIVHWPKGISRKGDFENQRGHAIDLMATIVELAGVEYPESYAGHDVLPMEGISLLPAFNGESLPERIIGAEHEANRAIFKGRYKLVSKNFTSIDGQAHLDWELYDMENDPLETKDIASQNYGIVLELAKDWHQWATRTDGIVGYERWMLKLQHYWQTGSRSYLNDTF